MKALCVRQPWAAVIVSGVKDVENRTWTTKYRGPLLICSSLTADVPGLQFDPPVEALMARGAIIGVVDVVDVVRDSSSRWAESGSWHWLLANARALATPIPIKGRLGLFDVDFDFEAHEWR